MGVLKNLFALRRITESRGFEAPEVHSEDEALQSHAVEQFDSRFRADYEGSGRERIGKHGRKTMKGTFPPTRLVKANADFGDLSRLS